MQIEPASPDSEETAETRVRQFLESTSPAFNVIALIGPGGVGKSTTLRSIARDPVIKRNFHGAMTFIELGGQQAYPAFIMELVRFVQNHTNLAWANAFVASALDETSQRKAILCLAEVLNKSSQPMLLILDDVSPRDGSMYRFIQGLVVSVRNCDTKFKLLISTSGHHIMDAPEIELHPHPPTGSLAKRIFCEHAGAAGPHNFQAMSHENLQAATAILEKCAGLPLTLCIAGRALQSLQTCSLSQDTLWVEYWDAMSRSVAPSNLSHGHAAVYEVVMSSIATLKPIWPNHLMIVPEELFCSFCVFKRGTEIPLHILSAVWGVTIDQAQLVVDLLCFRNLIYRLDSNNDEPSASYKMHDMIHACAVHNAENSRSVSSWHQKLLSTSRQRFSSRGAPAKDDDAQFWVDNNVMSDTYMLNNIVYHLTLAQEITTAIEVLLDYQRIETLNFDKTHTPFHQLLNDASTISAFIKRRDKRFRISSGECSLAAVENDVEYLIEVLKMIMPACASNRNECVYQLHGRLCTPNGETGLFDWCLHSVEKYAQRPWCRPMEGMLDSPDQSLKRILNTVTPIEAMASSPRKEEVLVAHAETSSSEANIEVLDSYSGRRKSRSHLYGDSDLDIRWPFERKSSDWTARDWVISFLTHADEVIVLSAKGMAVVWRGQNRVRECMPFVGCHRAKCMAIVGKNMIAFGSDQGKIMVLDLTTWEIVTSVFHVGLPDKDDAFDEVQGKPSPVMAICAGRDEDTFFSLCSEGYVRKWETKTGKSHGFATSIDGRVDRMAVSGDGSLVAFAMANGKLQICNAATGMVKKTLVGHRGAVSAILFSHNNRVLYSGGVDKSVQYWNVSSGTRIGKPFRLHESSIRGLAISEDGSELFSASKNQLCVSNGVPHQFGNLEKGMESGLCAKVNAYCLSWDKETLVTVEPDRIRFRNLCDPITRYEAMQMVWAPGLEDIPSLYINIQDNADVVEHVSVSTDSRIIAYTVRHRNFFDDDLSKTDIYIAHRIGRSGWTRAKRVPGISETDFPNFVNASIEKLEFLIDNTIDVIFRPQLGQFTMQMTLLQTAGVSGNEWNWQPEACERVHMDDWGTPLGLSLKNGESIYYGARVMGRLDKKAMPHRYIQNGVANNAVLFDEKMKRLWILNQESRLQYVDLVTPGAGRELVSPVPLPKIQVSDIEMLLLDN